MTPSIVRRFKSPTIPRIAIRSPAEGDEPRSRLELNALRALGFVLDKREWWMQWTTNQQVRDEWIREMEDLLIQDNVAQVLAVWPRVDRPSLRVLFTPLIEAAAANDTVTLKNLLQDVMYPVPTDVENDAFNEDPVPGTDDESEWRDSDDDDEDGDAEDSEHEGDDDSEDDTALDEDGNIVAFDAALAQARLTHGLVDGVELEEDEDVAMDAAEMIQLVDEALDAHESKNPFGQIGWYVKMAILRECLLSLDGTQDLKNAVDTAVEQTLRLGTATVTERTVELIQEVLRHPDTCSVLAIQAQLPGETRAAVLDALHVHFAAVAEVLEMTINDIKAVLDIVIHRLGLPAKPEDLAPATTITHPGPVPMTWMSDSLVPPELKAKFVSEVAALESVHNDVKDWDAANQVLRLIDPSLFCGVVGETKRLPQSAMNKLYGNAAEHMRAIMFAQAKSNIGGAKKNRSKFQWLPCEVQVDEEEDGAGASILTYINNLHPEQHAAMYDSISAIFTRFVPIFDTVLSSLDDQAEDRVASALYGQRPGSLPCPLRLVPGGVFELAAPQISLKGSRCQVIVKMEEIHLTPEKPTYTGSSWSTQGTETESIIATGIYVFSCENIIDCRASMQVFVNAGTEEEADPVRLGFDYGLVKSSLSTQGLGSVSTIEDRCFVFLNLYQFKTEPFQLQDTSQPGVCKILTFYLVDPNAKPIPSTAVVPPQQQDWIVGALEPPLKRLRVRSPTENKPVDKAREGLSIEQAKANRVKAGEERE